MHFPVLQRTSRLVIVLAVFLLAGCQQVAEVPVPTSLPPTPVKTAEVTVSATSAVVSHPSVTKSIGIQIIGHLDEKHGWRALVDFPQMGWLSVNLYWSDVERRHTDPPTYDWHSPDQTLGRAAKAGFKVIATVYGNPGWASKTRCIPNEVGQTALPKFVQAMVARYSQPPYNVHDWAFYNEPDFGGDKIPCWGNDPAGYAALLKELYPLVKKADPQATVYLGGLAYETFPGAPFDPAFLDDFMAAGGGDAFDVMNFHFYSAFHYVWDRFGPGVAGKANYLRSELKRFGYEKPIACTEIGHPTAGPPADKQDYSEEATSRYVAKGIVRALADDVKPIIWFSLTDPEEDVRRFGLLNQKLQPKKPFFAFQTLLEQLDGTHFDSRLPFGEKSKMEGYQFTTDDGRLLWVVWSRDGKPYRLKLSASSVTVVDMQGLIVQQLTQPAGGGKIEVSDIEAPHYLWVKR